MSAELAPIFRKPYMLGGHSVITVVSKKTGDRFTYRIRAPKNKQEKEVHFVAVLTSDDNENGYQFLGTIFDGDTYYHGKKSIISPAAPSAKAFSWLWRNLDSDQV